MDSPLLLIGATFLISLLGCTGPDATSQKDTDDRIASKEGKKLWMEFKQKITPSTATLIEKNFHLAAESPYTLTWCDYIQAPRPEEYQLVEDFLKQQLLMHEEADNDIMVKDIVERLDELSRTSEERSTLIAAEKECLLAYGNVPERKLLPGRNVKVDL